MSVIVYSYMLMIKITYNNTIILKINLFMKFKLITKYTSKISVIFGIIKIRKRNKILLYQ